jgi:hypothetical protein
MLIGCVLGIIWRRVFLSLKRKSRLRGFANMGNRLFEGTVFREWFKPRVYTSIGFKVLSLLRSFLSMDASPSPLQNISHENHGDEK